MNGPLAIVEVERSPASGETSGGSGGGSEERVLDVALPARSALMSWEVTAHGTAAILAPSELAPARAAYAAALGRWGVRSTQLGMDEGTTFRMHLAARAADTRHVTIRYRFVSLLDCQHGRFVLRLPGSLDLSPVAADVRVAFPGSLPSMPPAALQIAGMSARSPVNGNWATGRAPARAPWEISFALPRNSGRTNAIQGLAARARLRPQRTAERGRSMPAEEALAIGVCRPEGERNDLPPDRLLLLVDRSRSVGPAGIAAERDFARTLLQALPPQVRVNAVLFDRAAFLLFPVPRSATLEALAAVEGSIDAALSRNGTDLSSALEAAARAARADKEGEGGRTWFVILTDGALSDSHTAEVLRRAAAGISPQQSEILIFIVRSRTDDAAPSHARVALSALAAKAGGVVRAVDPASINVAVEEGLSAVRRGGDLFSLELIELPNGSRRPPRTLAVNLAPGTGHSAVMRRAGGSSSGTILHLRATVAGEPIKIPIKPVTVSERSLRPLLESRPPGGWTLTRDSVAAFVETTTPIPVEQDGSPKGEMDRMVIRNALSLAYLPRARACYLNRTVSSPEELALRGRVRLELHLARGEMADAVVRSSTLARPDIEACLQKTAYEIEVPRALGRDAPVIAALNLVFQPRTSPPTDASPGSDEIDLLIGPITDPANPRDLLR